MKLKFNKILQRERNVLIGFICVAILVALISRGRHWKIMLYLYAAHCLVMSGYYYYKSKYR